MVACCLLTIFFVSLTLGHKAQSAGLPDLREPWARPRCREHVPGPERL